MFAKTKKYNIQVEPISSSPSGSPRSEASGSPSGSPRSEASGSPRSNTSSPNFFQRAIEKAKGKFRGSRPLTPENSTLTPAEQEELADIRAQAEQELEIGRDITEQWRKIHGKNPKTLEDFNELKRLTKEALINAGFTTGFNTGGKTRKRRGSRRRKRRGSRRHKRTSKRSRR